jgi:hypothetical protein
LLLTSNDDFLLKGIIPPRLPKNVVMFGPNMDNVLFNGLTKNLTPPDNKFLKFWTHVVIIVIEYSFGLGGFQS